MGQRKQVISLVCVTALVVSLLLGCGGESAERSGGSRDGDSVVIALDPGSEPEAGFDPAYGWGAGEHVHEPLIQSTLTVTNTDLTIGYDLATGYSVSEDGLTWQVTIRRDAKFTDGEPLTAEDVAFTYNTVKETSSVNDFTMLDHAEAADDTTVIFHMTRPFSIWPYTMAEVGILPEHAYDSATYGTEPVGSGRYILKQWDKGQQVILEANPDYYGEAPKMKQVTILFMEEDAAFLAAQSGQVDLAYTSATYSEEEVEGYTLAAYESVDNRGLNLPAIPETTDSEGRAVGNDFTSDVLVRRAINIGVDRQEMIDHVLNGYGSPAYSVCDQLPWYNEASEVSYDPEGAAALLDEAGWVLGEDGVREKDGVQAKMNLLIPMAILYGRHWRQILRIRWKNWGLSVRSRAWAGIRLTTGLYQNLFCGDGEPIRPWNFIIFIIRLKEIRWTGRTWPSTRPMPMKLWTHTWIRRWRKATWKRPILCGSRHSGTEPPV